MNISVIIKKNIRLIAIQVFFLINLNFCFAENTEVGYPFFHNIKPSESGYGNINYSITQDYRDLLYVGNFNGILEFDNSEWRLIKVNGNPILRTDRHDRIYCGTYNEIGKLVPDSLGKAVYKTIYYDSTNSIGEITNLFIENEKIIFSNDKAIYTLQNQSVTKIFCDSINIKLFDVNRQIYFSSSQGLMKIDNSGKILNCLDISQTGNKQIIDILPRRDNDLLLITTDSLFQFNGSEKKSSFSSKINEVIKTYGFSKVIKLSNRHFAVGTNTGGIFFFSHINQIDFVLDKNTGLYDDKIVDMYVDHSNILWLALSNGLTKIEIPSAFSYFDHETGLRGRVNSIIRHQDTLYAATSDGLYKLIGSNSQNKSEIFKNSKFVKTNEIASECHQLLSIGNELLIASSNGLWSLKSGIATKILNDNILLITQSISDKSTFYVATNDNEIKKLTHQNSTWNHNKNDVVKNISAHTMVADVNNLWIGTLYDGVLSIEIDKFGKNAVVKEYKNGRGLPQEAHWIDVYSTSKGILFSTYTGLYWFDKQLERFCKDDILPMHTINSQKRVIPIVEDGSRNLWLAFESDGFYKRQIAVAWNIGDSSTRYTLISQPFLRLKNFVCDEIYPDSNFVVWFGGFDGIIRLDFKQLRYTDLDVSTYLREVSIDKDSVITYGPEFNRLYSEQYLKIPHRYNSLKFKFATPIFEGNNESKHFCKLEGYDDDWLQTDNNIKEYANLAPGNYRFLVKAENMYGHSSKPAVFQFTILKPAYSTWWAIVAYILLFLSFIIALTRYRAYKFAKEKIKLEKIISERTEELLHEKEKTERLLANILPERTVKELKDKGRATSMRFSMVTVLFSDIQGFTKIAEQMNPSVLVDELDKFFLQFDNVVERCNIEKIKTIGDAYMCAGGIPQKNRTNPIEVVAAALEMQYYVDKMKKEAAQNGRDYWNLRIGIHTGPVVAGVIGSKKFTYDIWGDTVNIASRMESSGQIGKVNVSEDTYLLIQQYFNCEYRGKMPVKYKGEIDMYFVNSFKEEYADSQSPIFPNQLFREKLKLLKYEDLEIYILDKLEEELPKNVYYHNVKHTIDVIVHAEIIGRSEGISNEDLLLLKTAALFHDIGFTMGYKEHEMLSIQIAADILPSFHYTEEQIKIIGDLIYATRIPHNPHNLLEQIICDADLDYLGRSDYYPVSRCLYQELLEQGTIKASEYEWNKLQIKFMQSHAYFTETAKRTRLANKMKHLEMVQKELELLS